MTQLKSGSITDRYPELRTLIGKVPQALIESEAGPKATRLEELRAVAAQSVPTVLLGDIFPAEIELGAIRLQNFLGRWGNVSVEELCKICLVVSWLRPRSIFEFGTYNGLTTYQLALNAPSDCVIYTLDIDPAAAAALEIGEIDSYLARKVGAFDSKVGQYFHNTPEAARIQQLWGDSTKLDFTAFEGSIDLVFVDAGHTYEYVRSDSGIALRMLRPGGVILWHDYLRVLHPDVTQYLCELSASGVPVRHLRGTGLAVHRKPV